MAIATGTTVHLEPRVYKAVRLRATATRRTIAAVANETLLRALREDADDLAAIKSRRDQPARPYGEVRKALKRDGLL